MNTNRPAVLDGLWTSDFEGAGIWLAPGSGLHWQVLHKCVNARAAQWAHHLEQGPKAPAWPARLDLVSCAWPGSGFQRGNQVNPRVKGRSRYLSQRADFKAVAWRCPPKRVF